MKEPKPNTEDVSVSAELVIIAIAIAFLALIVAITSGGDIKVKIDGVSGDDLNGALRICIPYNATFDQELSCYQAIYGGI